jgi:hypothetical protein
MKAARILCASLIGLGAMFAACMTTRDQPPRHTGIIGSDYHYCPHCHSLYGGMFGKGPDYAKARINGANRQSCRHEWQEVTKDRFKELAAEHHDRHLEAEGGYWAHKTDSDSVPNPNPN